MKALSFRMTGTNPLMLNNDQTSNPLNSYAKAIKAITSKRVKTDEDMEEIFHLKFLASLYQNNKGQYIIPSNMVSKSLECGAKENKLGKKFQQSVFFNNDFVLNFEHKNCTPEELYTEHADLYVDIRSVGVQKSKIATARAIFPEWSIEGELFFDETQLNAEDIWLAFDNAGMRHGIGTYRQVYGRYEVTEIKTNKKKK